MSDERSSKTPCAHHCGLVDGFCSDCQTQVEPSIIPPNRSHTTTEQVSSNPSLYDARWVETHPNIAAEMIERLTAELAEKEAAYMSCNRERAEIAQDRQRLRAENKRLTSIIRGKTFVTEQPDEGGHSHTASGASGGQRHPDETDAWRCPECKQTRPAHLQLFSTGNCHRIDWSAENGEGSHAD